MAVPLFSFVSVNRYLSSSSISHLISRRRSRRTKNCERGPIAVADRCHTVRQAANRAPVRLLVVYCHPHSGSYCHALLERVLAGLAVHGHDVDLLDLYAEGFDPVLREDEWLDYLHDPGKTVRGAMASHVARIERAEGLVFVFPTWFFGLPAMLKGWFDRAWLPGVAFDIPDGGVARSRLKRIRLLATVTTTGLPWIVLQTWAIPVSG